MGFCTRCSVIAVLLLAYEAISGAGEDKPKAPASGTGSTGPSRLSDSELARFLRAAPEFTEDGLNALLQLRDHPDARAVSVLEKTLTGVPRRSHNHYVAFQALFCIGTPEAHKILSNHGFPGPGLAKEAIGDTFHPRLTMGEPQRSRFIEQLILRDPSKDLEVLLEATQGRDREFGRIKIEIKVRNLTGGAIRLPEQFEYPGELLYFRAKDGAFVDRTRESKLDSPGIKWTALAQGATRIYPVDLLVLPKPVGLGPGSAVTIVTGGNCAFGIDKPGQYSLLAMLDENPGHGGWSGRVVSKPITVEISQAQPPTPDGR